MKFRLNMKRVLVMTPSKRKRREWMPLVFTFVICLFVCSWRMVILSEPDLLESGKQAGLIGQLGSLNALPVDVDGVLPGDLRYSSEYGKVDVTKPPVYSRHLEVKRRCKEVEDARDVFTPKLRFPFSPYISYEPKTFFCPLPKAGSTFFTRYFLTAQKAQQQEYFASNPSPSLLSPLNFSIESASRVKQLPFTIIKDPEERDLFLQESTKFVFTRHPYARLFSAYIDKLFAPNPVFWRNWGLAAVRFFNDTPINEHPCGAFISFPDFIKLVVGGLWKRDPHTMPMDQQCNFCETNYDVIGKLETVMTDVDFLSSKLNVSGAFIHDKSFKDYFVQDAVKDSTKDPLTIWRQKVSECVSDYTVGRLIWRKLQIRGFIDASITFPFSPKAMKTISLEQFQDKCFVAVEKSIDKDKLKRQKQVAFEEAFRLVPDKLFAKLQTTYANDFLLLDYDNGRPSDYVPGLRQETVAPLNWQVRWKM